MEHGTLDLAVVSSSPTLTVKLTFKKKIIIISENGQAFSGPNGRRIVSSMEKAAGEPVFPER